MISTTSTASTAARVALLAVALAITLAACSVILPARRPAIDVRSGGEVTKALEAIPGVILAEVRSGPDGLPGQNEMNADVVVQPGYAPGGDLLDYVLRQLWSQSETHITTKVSITLLAGTATESTPLDLQPALTLLGFTAYDHDATQISYSGYGLGTSEMTSHYGKWPGPVPELPAALVAASPPVTPTPAP